MPFNVDDRVVHYNREGNITYKGTIIRFQVIANRTYLIVDVDQEYREAVGLWRAMDIVHHFAHECEVE